MDEQVLVGRAVRSMMNDVKTGKIKTYDLDAVLVEEDKRRKIKSSDGHGIENIRDNH